MKDRELEKSKAWYMSAVESCLILRGLTRKRAEELIGRYRLKERLDAYPEVQLHYDVEAAADEIMAVA